MTPKERLLYERVQRRAQALSPELRRDILAAFQRLRERATDRQITEALTLGGEDRLFAEVLSDAALDRALRPLRDSIRLGVIDAGRAFQRDVPPLPRSATFTFDFLNPRVLDSIRVLETRVLTTLREAIRDTVREVVALGIAAGQGPRTYAPQLRASVGLAPNMVREIQHYRDALEGTNGRRVTDYTLRDKRFTKPPTTAAQVDAMVATYTKRRIAQHAETIARTAALTAQKVGQRQSWEDAVGQGIVARDRLRQTWVGVMDRRERDEHRAMEGVTIAFDEDFILPDGTRERTPGDSTYNCRCIARYTVAPKP